MNAQGENELSPELEKAIMEAIVGRNPVAYSKYGEETRERLVFVIHAELTKQREQAYKEGYNKRGEIVITGLPAVKRQAGEQARQQILDKLEALVPTFEKNDTIDSYIMRTQTCIGDIRDFIKANRTAPTEEDKKTKEK